MYAFGRPSSAQGLPDSSYKSLYEKLIIMIEIVKKKVTTDNVGTKFIRTVKGCFNNQHER
jgi:hypothetical protein